MKCYEMIFVVTVEALLPLKRGEDDDYDESSFKMSVIGPLLRCAVCAVTR